MKNKEKLKEYTFTEFSNLWFKYTIRILVPYLGILALYKYFKNKHDNK